MPEHKESKGMLHYKELKHLSLCMYVKCSYPRIFIL